MSEDFENHIRIYVPKDMSLDEGWDLEALLRTVEEAMTAAKTGKDGETFQMTVEAPATLDHDELDKLFEAVATAVYDFADRFPQRTWDVFVAGGVLSESHSAEAAFRHVFDENERLVQEHKTQRHALVLALGLEEDAPLPEMEELIGRVAATRALLEKKSRR